MSMNENLPVPSKPDQDEHPEKDSGKVLNVNHLHWYGNDMRELTRLAQVDPKLAHKIVAQAEKQSVREEGSFRFGLVATLILVVSLILGVVYVVVNAGVVALIGVIATILATALLLRVVLTGEWSETSWVGSILKALLTSTGARVPEDPPKT